MKLFIPKVGTKLLLTQPWSFKLYHDHRNESLLLLFNLIPNDAPFMGGRDRDQHDKVELDKGCILKIDRVFIRKNMTTYKEMFDSITFSLQLPNGKKNISAISETWIGGDKTKTITKQLRFLAKLKDVNKIECEVIK